MSNISKATYELMDCEALRRKIYVKGRGLSKKQLRTVLALEQLPDEHMDRVARFIGRLPL